LQLNTPSLAADQRTTGNVFNVKQFSSKV